MTTDAGLHRRDGTARILLRGMSWQSASQFIPLVVNLALTPVIIHGLGPARYSIFLLVSTLTAFLSQFDGGIGPSAMRFFTIYAGREDRLSTTRLLWSVSLVLVACSSVVVVAALALSRDILSFFRVAPEFMDEAYVLLTVLTAIIVLILLRNLVNAVLNARQLFRHTSVAMLVGYGVYIAGLLATIQFGWGLVGVAWTMVAQQLVGSVMTVPVGMRYLDRRGCRLVDRATAREFFGYSWRVQVTTVVSLLNGQKDQLVAGRVVSAQESGPYGQGVNFATQLRTMPMNAAFPMLAMIGSEVGARGAEAAVDKVERLQRIWVRAVAGWCLVGAVAALYGVRAWLPDTYATAAPVAAIVLAGGTCTLLLQVTKLWALALGHPGIEMRFGLFMLGSNIVLSVVLGLWLGMMGVVAATAAAQFVGMLYFSWDARRTLSIRPRWFVLDVPLPAVVLAPVVCWACELVAAPYVPRGALGLLACGVVATPAVVVYVVMAFGSSELRKLPAVLRQRRD